MLAGGDGSLAVPSSARACSFSTAMLSGGSRCQQTPARLASGDGERALVNLGLEGRALVLQAAELLLLLLSGVHQQALQRRLLLASVHG